MATTILGKRYRVSEASRSNGASSVPPFPFNATAPVYSNPRSREQTRQPFQHVEHVERKSRYSKMTLQNATERSTTVPAKLSTKIQLGRDLASDAVCRAILRPVAQESLSRLVRLTAKSFHLECSQKNGSDQSRPLLSLLLKTKTKTKKMRSNCLHLRHLDTGMRCRKGFLSLLGIG